MHRWRLIIGAVNFRLEQIVYLFKPCVCFPAHCLQIVLQTLVACGVGLHVLNHYSNVHHISILILILIITILLLLYNDTCTSRVFRYFS